MTYIPNSDKPTDAQEIEGAIIELYKCQSLGSWNLSKLNNWLERYPIEILHAAKRIDEQFEQIYPGRNV